MAIEDFVFKLICEWLKSMVLVPFAFVTGWAMYLIASAIQGSLYGFPNVLLTPIIGAILTLLAIVTLIVIGLPLRFFCTLQSFWQRHWWITFLLIGIGLILFTVSWHSTFSQQVLKSTELCKIAQPNGIFAIGGWLLTIFAILHADFPMSYLVIFAEKFQKRFIKGDFRDP